MYQSSKHYSRRDVIWCRRCFLWL